MRGMLRVHYTTFLEADEFYYAPFFLLSSRDSVYQRCLAQTRRFLIEVMQWIVMRIITITMPYVYKISSPSTPNIYIGSTVCAVSDRWSRHKYDFRMWKEGRQHYMSAFELTKFDDSVIETLCEASREELRTIEQCYIDTYADVVVNKRRSIKRSTIHHCKVCDRDFKLSLNSDGSVSTGAIHSHERTKKHQELRKKLSLPN